MNLNSPTTVKTLTGKLAELKKYNAMTIPAEYFDDAMTKLRGQRFLNRALESVSHPVSGVTQQITIEQKAAANEAPPVDEETLTAQTWFERGYVFQEEENLDEAFCCYSEVIRIDPNSEAAYNNLGALLVDLKRYEEAEEAYRKAIELNPSLPESLLQLGQSY